MLKKEKRTLGRVAPEGEGLPPHLYYLSLDFMDIQGLKKAWLRDGWMGVLDRVFMVAGEMDRNDVDIHIGYRLICLQDNIPNKIGDDCNLFPARYCSYISFVNTSVGNKGVGKTVHGRRA